MTRACKVHLLCPRWRGRQARCRAHDVRASMTMAETSGCVVADCVVGGARSCRRGMQAAVALMVTRISDDRSVPSAIAPSSMAWTSGCCRADGVGESDDDGSDERCRCSTGRRWGLPRVGGSWRLRTQATMWM